MVPYWFRSCSVLSSWGSSPVLSSGSVCGLVDIFEFLLRKKGLYGLDIMLATQSIEV